jgi:hypothetical protein
MRVTKGLSAFLAIIPLDVIRVVAADPAGTRWLSEGHDSAIWLNGLFGHDTWAVNHLAGAAVNGAGFGVVLRHQR